MNFTLGTADITKNERHVIPLYGDKMYRKKVAIVFVNGRYAEHTYSDEAGNDHGVLDARLKLIYDAQLLTYIEKFEKAYETTIARTLPTVGERLEERADSH